MLVLKETTKNPKKAKTKCFVRDRADNAKNYEWIDCRQFALVFSILRSVIVVTVHVFSSNSHWFNALFTFAVIYQSVITLVLVFTTLHRKPRALNCAMELVDAV